MPSPCTETIIVHFTEHEHNLIEGLAELRGMSASDMMRELIGFDRYVPSPTRRHLELVPQDEGGGRRRSASPSSCLAADDLRHPLVAPHAPAAGCRHAWASLKPRA